MEASMRKLLLALASAATLGLLATSGANAMPIAPAPPIASGVNHVHLVCNEWGRCWRRPDYYRPYGYYGYGYGWPRYRHYGYGWPHRHYYYGPRFYGGWGW